MLLIRIKHPQLRKTYINKTLFIVLISLSSCYFPKKINKVAREKGLTVKQVGEINLLGAHLDIRSNLSDKKNVVYLLYKGDSLQYLSSEKSISNGDFIYRVQKWKDSLYMLTRRSQFRYLLEDTVLFHTNYVVSNRCTYGRDPMGKLEAINAEFKCHYLMTDSIIQFEFHSNKPITSLHQYNPESDSSKLFISDYASANRSYKTILPKWQIGDLMNYFLR